MEMPGLTAARGVIGEFTFCEFSQLRLFRASVTPADEGHPAIEVEMHMEAPARRPPCMLVLRFGGVQSLQIRDMGGEAAISGFDVVDASDRQLENIHWRIEDFEEGVVEFFAATAEILSASLIEKCQER